MKLRNLLVAAVLMVAGCGNFNTVLLVIPVEGASNTSSPAPVDSAHAVGQAAASALRPGTLCPLFIPPELPAIPPLPLAELARVPAADSRQIDTIQQRHIEDVRSRIREDRRLLREAYDRYVENCRAKPNKSK